MCSNLQNELTRAERRVVQAIALARSALGSQPLMAATDRLTPDTAKLQNELNSNSKQACVPRRTTATGTVRLRPVV